MLDRDQLRSRAPPRFPPRSALLSRTMACLALALTLMITSAPPVARAGPVQCFANSQLCFQAAATPGNPQSTDFLFTTKVAAGWISVGIGEGMDNADMIMLWRTPAGDWTFSRRLSTGYTRPPAAQQQLYTLVNSTRVADPTTGTFQILVRRPAARPSTNNAADRAVVNAAMPMAWAVYSGSGVGANNLPKHTNEGRFEYVGALDTVSPVCLGRPWLGRAAEREAQGVVGQRGVVRVACRRGRRPCWSMEYAWRWLGACSHLQPSLSHAS
ncbi:hypothetical protein BCR44DRAFT_1191639 [Catenaria anguillulae PL171]|uniref:DOMON domain-containing protein n=1 Tax=Catenaria anguillulae PL171 TaxID=765915 RepID=A0A1Y2HGX6_9FUNG|nr:hypothetical protein BCR44DRAFT_1191639 [Catenaria anguillulae PL171]